ncbi:MAG: hypothetical protein ACFB2W_04410 [Leptolyngbyaceae cyanobacterium]
MQSNSRAQKGESVKTVSVKQFFEQFNWYGKALSDISELPTADTPYETVGQFFGTFPWQGATTALSGDDWLSDNDVDDAGVVSTDSDTLTLEDLSALF